MRQTSPDISGEGALAGRIARSTSSPAVISETLSGDANSYPRPLTAERAPDILVPSRSDATVGQHPVTCRVQHDTRQIRWEIDAKSKHRT